MTREEAIKILKSKMDGNTDTSYEWCECVRMAIKALECEPDKKPFDKIRAEIMQLDYDIESVDYDYNDMAQTEVVHTICREEVLRIIDKYKEESERK